MEGRSGWPWEELVGVVPPRAGAGADSGKRSVFDARLQPVSLPGHGRFLATGGRADADVIIFKDGFVLNGKVKQGSEVYIDPLTHQPVMISKGPFYLDGDARLFSFSYSQIGDVDKNDPANEADLVKVEYHVPHIFPAIIPPIVQVDRRHPLQ